MRAQTIKSASRLRRIGVFIFTLSLIFGIMFILFTLINFLSELDMIMRQSDSTRQSLLLSILIIPSVYGLLTIISGLIIGAIFDGFATAIENLDKTSLIASIDRNTLSNLENDNSDLSNYLNSLSDAFTTTDY